MKKNLSVTLGGRSFTIDEDAYHALDAYIEGIKSHYAGDDPDGEIASDFESRIADLFAEQTGRLGLGSTVTIDIVRRTIEQVGSLDRLFDDDEEAGRSAQPGGEGYHYQATGTSEQAAEGGEIPTPPTPPAYASMDQRGPRPRHIYYRSTSDRWFAGVLGGLGEYLGMDALLFRLTFIALLFTPLHPGLVIVYLAMWLFVPEAKTVTQKLELHGIPVSPTTIWQGIDQSIAQGEVSEQGQRSESQPRLTSFIPSKARKAILWTGGTMFVLGILVATVGVFVGLVEGEIFQADYFEYWDYFISTGSGVLFIIAGCLAGLPLLTLLVYLVGVIPIGMILQSKRSSSTVKAVSIALWIIFLLALRYILF